MQYKDVYPLHCLLSGFTRLFPSGHILLSLFICTVTSSVGLAQPALAIQDSFDRNRFFLAAGTGVAIYGLSTYALHRSWYEDFERTSFHLFNDWGEWKNMDKMGHAFSAYLETEVGYLAGRWVGISPKPAVWTAAGLSLLFQSTIELFDAHSSKWGFSWPDMAFNLAGTALYTSQQLVWKEQRIRLKISSWPSQYPTDPILSTNELAFSSISRRTNELFGSGYLERYLKDYNAQTVWVSVNPASFMQKSTFPKWLNLAMGYSVENLFGGYSNSWSEDGHHFAADTDKYPRIRQWFLSSDVDFSRIPTKSKFLKTVFSLLNFFKVPAPTVGLDEGGQLRWYWIYL